MRRTVEATHGTYHLVQSFGLRLRNQNPLNVQRLFEQIRKGFFGGAQSGVSLPGALEAVRRTTRWRLEG